MLTCTWCTSVPFQRTAAFIWRCAYLQESKEGFKPGTTSGWLSDPVQEATYSLALKTTSIHVIHSPVEPVESACDVTNSAVARKHDNTPVRSWEMIAWKRKRVENNPAVLQLMFILWCSAPSDWCLTGFMSVLSIFCGGQKTQQIISWLIISWSIILYSPRFKLLHLEIGDYWCCI